MSSKRHNRELVKLVRTTRVSRTVTDDSIYQYLSALDCPTSLAVWLLYSNNEHQQLVDLEVSPLNYLKAYQFRDAYAAVQFLSKSDFLNLAVSKQDAAFEKFHLYEEHCKQTNNRFRNLLLDPKYHGTSVWLLNATARKIEQILGPFDPERWFDNANWGPGVTTLLKGSHVSAVNKFHSENGITRDLYSLVGDLIPVAYPGWWKHLTDENPTGPFAFQLGNRVVTVPKNSKTDRVIAVEPGVNLFLQKGLGAMIRNRLRRFGINLNSQVNNQLLAKKASKDDSLATVDFSSASDTISTEVVRALLPPEWFQVLSACRCQLGFERGNLIRWQKFSSMGNGYTFELESLIFFAAAQAVQELTGSTGEISVFGDDVILPKADFEMFSDFSDFLGFVVNKRKSFSSSYFRESCGAHYFSGFDCKPIFLKERLSNAQAIYRLANNVRWLSHRRNSHYGCDSRLRRCWSYLYHRVPKPLRFGISAGKGDGGFILNFDEATPVRARDGIEGYYTSCLLESGVSQNFEGTGLLLARLKALPDQVFGSNRKLTAPVRFQQRSIFIREILDTRIVERTQGNAYTLRGETKLSVGRILIHQWYNLGPWI
jgi:hypothetical protein